MFVQNTRNHLPVIHICPLQLACPDVLSLVGELLLRYRWSSSDPHIVFAIFMYLRCNI